MEFINWKEDKDKFGLYLIECKIDSKVYVGQTKQKFKRRYYHHLWKLKQGSHDNKHLQKSFDKHGEENFTFKLLLSLDDPEKLDEEEIKKIKYYREIGKCYNMQDGGQPSVIGKLTEEGRKSIAEKNRKRMLGTKLSEETKLKMSESHKGKRYNKDKYIIDENIAFIIKSRLIKGDKAKIISEDLNISYKIVNGILSNNSWDIVKVPGWELFQNTRRKTKRLSMEDYLLIKKDYDDGMKINDIAVKYERTRHAIQHALKKVKEFNI